MNIEEIILAKKLAGGSSPSVDIEQLNATENGTYSEQGKAYSPVIVEVPAPTLKTKTITENGTYNASEDNADGYSSVTVNVPYMEKKSASGDIASFSDGTGYPFLKVKANINPVQDLHGQDYPWVGGAGKNKFNPANLTENRTLYGIDAVGTSPVLHNSAASKVYKNIAYLNANTTYVISFRINGSMVSSNERKGYICDNDGLVLENNLTTQASTDNYTTITPTVSGWLWGSFDNSTTDLQLELGNQATSYTPYSNICPISGFTGVNVAVTGKNLFSGVIEQGTITADGSLFDSSTRIRTHDYIPVDSGTFTLSLTSETDVYVYVFVYDENMNMLRRIPSDNWTRLPYTFTLTDGKFIKFVLRKDPDGTTISPSDVSQVQLELGSSATSYEAYNGHVYPVSWQDEAGIVYGGYIDLVSGVLTVTKAGITEYNGETLPSAWISDRDRYVAGNTPTIGAQVVYDLATPQTYQLTPQQINTLIGQNNAWNNTNGQTEVEYFIPIE